MSLKISRRELVQGAIAAGSLSLIGRSTLAGQVVQPPEPALEEFGYDQVERTQRPPLHDASKLV